MASESSEEPWLKLDTSVAHSARIYDYLLGGKDNFAADRVGGDVSCGPLFPRCAPRRARTARSLAGRSATWPEEAGIGQFLDIGTGLPTASNVHEVAQGITPCQPGRLRRQ